MKEIHSINAWINWIQEQYLDKNEWFIYLDLSTFFRDDLPGTAHIMIVVVWIIRWCDNPWVTLQYTSTCYRRQQVKIHGQVVKVQIDVIDW